MPRKKQTTLCFWFSARPDNKETRFIQMGNSLYLSKAFHSLGLGARYLLGCMGMESAGHRQFQFPESAAKKYAIPPASLWRYVKELESAGFIKVYSNKRLRKPNVTKIAPFRNSI